MNITEFELKEEHLKLLRKMYVDWQDGYGGAPEINLKRPYGNSDVVYDVYEILHGREWNYEEEDEMSESLYEEMLQWHRETQYALQIVLNTGKFETGVYSRPEKYCTRTWVKT